VDRLVFSTAAPSGARTDRLIVSCSIQGGVGDQGGRTRSGCLPPLKEITTARVVLAPLSGAAPDGWIEP
jgi:hypothetical protein